MKSPRDRPGRRAQQQARTHRRIVEAAAQLHEEIGPAATTISAVAARAGVQRLTVYRHFPDEAALFAACSAHTSARHPPPDPATWAGIGDAAARLGTALRALYAYYHARASALSRVLRDAERLPALHEALAPLRDYQARVAVGLAAGWPVAPGAERPFRAALAHALDFWTWRSLAALELDTEEAARLMEGLVTAAAEDAHRSRADQKGSPR